MDSECFWAVFAFPDTTAALTPYLAHLRALPFVKAVRCSITKSVHPGFDAMLEVTTPSGRRKVRVEWKKSHLSRDVIEHLLSRLAGVEGDVLLFAPLVGRTIGERLRQAGVGYLDLAGNCHVEWGKTYIAHVEGRKLPERAPLAKTLRVPSLLVLFSLLARPGNVGASTRQLALAAGGVSPQTATDLRKRLVAETCVIPMGVEHCWTPRGKERALELLVAGYEQLATHLRIGRFRARSGSLAELEQRIAGNLDQGPTWFWGGGAALYRRNRVHRGARTLVYVDGPLPTTLPGLVPDANGEVIFARSPGPCAHDPDGHVSPLLIYLDLLTERDPRAVEVAEGLRPTLFKEAWA